MMIDSLSCSSSKWRSSAEQCWFAT